MNCIIIANGILKNLNFYNEMLKNSEVIIAVDGGANYLFKINIIPNVIIGDLDSISSDAKKYYEKQKVSFIKYPTKKDFTDTEIAIDYAKKIGVKSIVFIGVLGKRFDHSIANIFLLKKTSFFNIPAKIIDENSEIYFLTGASTLNIEGKPKDVLSIIPISQKVIGITLKGLEYPLKNSNLKFSSSRGISNVFKKKSAIIKIKEGDLLVIKVSSREK